ncbi:SusC/RagA family TonB-linked outer membrane protein [uncultured Acetobacteroides sp.]|uniref:SusC/RagA family TonB-linked outer membrane protein n=1 Tax=uncultured Acetobacteroides sp. TaxID=1760811 RepID=UPI0029F5076A|nr:SusC/RagA family TonB-linked outer membrane protein [uncultured Acetobacteroides sp.]
MRRFLTLLVTIVVFGVSPTLAQTKQISGKVVGSNDNLPIPGVSVLVKEAPTVGTATDINGSFTLKNIPGHAKTLVFRIVGYKTVEIPITGTTINATLQPESKQIDEVMVVAYGTTSRKSFTGSAAKVDAEQLQRKNPSEISKALAGEIAGVQVINSNGQPGSSASIRIRGIGSAYSSRAPLYVIDGIPYEGSISGIDPSDIATTTVLKDASATALYGTRAANGVILLTTKKGEKGKTKIEADFKYGMNIRLIPQYNIIKNPENFTELTWEGLRNKYQYNTEDPLSATDAATAASGALFDADNGIYPIYNMWNADGKDLIDPATGKFKNVSRKYTPEKWDDYLFRPGKKMEGSVKISAGNDNSSHYTSFGYLKDEGYYIGSDFQRFTARSNIDQTLTSWMKSTLNMSYAYMEKNNPGQEDNMNNGFQFVNFMPSLFPVFQRDAKGNKIPDTILGGDKYDYGMYQDYGRSYASGINPAGAIKLDKNKTISHQFNGNANIEARFLTNFKFTANLGMQYRGEKLDALTNPYYGDAAGIGRIEKTAFWYLGLTANQILSWTKSFGSHNLNAFVAHESNYYDMSDMTGQKSKIARPSNLEWSNAVIMGNMDSKTYGYSLESYFGQINYDYDNRFFINGSIRRDGSSRFVDDNKWGTFGSIGAAWLLTRENFLSNVNWLKSLKYKASWGVLGNQEFNTTPSIAGYYPYEDLYNISNLNDQLAFSFAYKGNRNLTWENSKTFNTGFEFDIANFLTGEVEYYHKTTTDMLFMKQVATSLGYASYPVNDGKMVNQGVELTLNASVVKSKDLNVNVRFNAGHYKNEMITMPMDETTGKEKPLEINTFYGWAKNHSLYDFYIREYAGVDPTTGLSTWNSYYNVLPDGTKEHITDMQNYTSSKTINKLEVVKTSNYDEATNKFVGKSAIPDVSGGFGFDVNYKGIEFNTTFMYAIGGYAYDGVYASLMGNGTPGSSNWSKDILNRWQKPGDITDVPRLSSDYDKNVNATSTRFLTKRSYLSFSNARIAYSLPKSVLSKLNVNRLTFFVSGDNLFLLSARKGFVSMSSESGNSDRSQYIPLTTFIGGVTLQF